MSQAVEIALPQLGETVTEGTITRWFKQIGDAIIAEEPLFEVSTDKVDTEVPSPVAGTLTEIRASEGTTVPVGAVIAVVGATNGVAGPQIAPEPPAAAPDVAAVREHPRAAPAVERAPAAVAPVSGAASAAAAQSVSGSWAPHDRLSPVVRPLVQENGLDRVDIVGTGAGGRITRDDVLERLGHGTANQAASATPAVRATLETPLLAPAPVAPASAPSAFPPEVRVGERDEIVKLSKIRQLTGAHMVMSKAVTPHAFSVVEVDFANVDRTRRVVKNDWKTAEGFGLTYLPFIARAVVDAMAEFPYLNASMNGDELVVHTFVDLGIAVDLDHQGLLVPLLRSAETKRLRFIAREINDLASRARNRKLSPDEIQGGTFTISNNGSAGSVLTMPIINQPQVAILSTDAIARKPVVMALPDGSESIGIHPLGNLAMAWDHRALDGAYAARFLGKVRAILETRDWSTEL